MKSQRVCVVAVACAQASGVVSRVAPRSPLFPAGCGAAPCDCDCLQGTGARAHSADAHMPSAPGQAARWAKQDARLAPALAIAGGASTLIQDLKK